MKLSYFLAMTCVALPSYAIAEEKHHEDPTKIITRIGVGYGNSDLRFNGSLGLDESRMINGSFNQDLSEWSLGGSWLFDAGILNFDFRKTDFGSGSESQSYSIGTFIPTNWFSDWGMMTFLTGGYNYNDGQTMNDGIIERHSGHSGYIGLFALKPVNDKLTAMGVVGTTQGKHSSYWGGAGASYLINSNNSFNALLVGVDNSLYGSDNRVVVNYRYEFK